MMKPLSPLALLLMAEALFVGVALTASAAPVVWATPRAVAADADVNTNGTLFAAFTGASSAKTVNGVTFAPFSGNWTYSISSGNVLLANQGQAGYPNFIFNNGSVFTSTNTPFSSLSSSYRGLLAGANYSGNGSGTDVWTLTFTNLTAGAQYELQLWVSDPRSLAAARSETLDDGSNARVLLPYNNQAREGGVGTVVTGFFTAGATRSQSVRLQGNASTQLNAFQLRASAGPAQVGADVADLSVFLYRPATFSVGARGTAPFGYQWYRSGVKLAGATNATYTLASAQLGDSGAQFRCVISNVFNSISHSATSRVATLTVTPAIGTLNAAVTHQTLTGFGASIAFYNNWLTAHPYKQEIYTNIFSGLGLDILRLGNWFRYPGTTKFDTHSMEIVSNATRVLGFPVPIQMSSWSPPAFLKSNGKVASGTLITTNGGIAYTQFANYWYDSLLAYKTNGISPTWISIQNEPDIETDYDSCKFLPSERNVTNITSTLVTNQTVVTTNYVTNIVTYASYSKALDATYQRLTNLASPPKLLASEVLGIGYNNFQSYAATMNSNSFFGVAHHLYHGGSDDAPDTYRPAMQSLTNIFPDKPRFQTEFFGGDGLQTAWLIHNSLTVEEVTAYLYWHLIWDRAGLVALEFPWDGSRASWTNAPPGSPTQAHGYWITDPYYALKHFAYFTGPGYRRVDASVTDTNVLLSAYLSPDNQRLTVVLLNTLTQSAVAVNLNPGGFLVGTSAVYQTAGATKFGALGPLATNSQLTLPAGSITTVVLAAPVYAGVASNPIPASGATNVTLSPNLRWTAGTNATAHRIFFGANSNAVAVATTNAAEFKGSVGSAVFLPGALASSGRFFWRVDEMAGSYATAGPVWNFATVVVTNDAPSLGGAMTGTNAFVVRFASRVGQRYRLERASSLAPASWTVLADNVPGTGSVIAIADGVAAGQSPRFYRLVLVAP